MNTSHRGAALNESLHEVAPELQPSRRVAGAELPHRRTFLWRELEREGLDVVLAQLGPPEVVVVDADPTVGPALSTGGGFVSMGTGQ
jgi:hypothetical protein